MKKAFDFPVISGRILCNMNKVTKLNSTGGRFSTLVASVNGKRNAFCAKITSATEKYVSFWDVNAEKNRRIATSNVVAMKSGKTRFAVA